MLGPITAAATRTSCFPLGFPFPFPFLFLFQRCQAHTECYKCDSGNIKSLLHRCDFSCFGFAGVSTTPARITIPLCTRHISLRHGKGGERRDRWSLLSTLFPLCDTTYMALLAYYGPIVCNSASSIVVLLTLLILSSFS